LLISVVGRILLDPPLLFLLMVMSGIIGKLLVEFEIILIFFLLKKVHFLLCRVYKKPISFSVSKAFLKKIKKILFALI
jgi:hypothetical protein